MGFGTKIFVFMACTICSSSEVVETDVGKVEGTTLQSRSGQSFHAFYRIPFAVPPLNASRFQAPQPVKAWSGVLDGTKKGPLCFQADHLKINPDEMSEDCLHINIYTKDLNASKPVIVWIHGGGFEVGSGLGLGIIISSL
jgi:carboxylesterase type B